jgi:hypothetical protein
MSSGYARGATAGGGKTLSRSTTSYTIRLFVLVVSMALIGADLTVSAQNANTSTTTPEDTSMQNTNMSNTNMNRSGRRRRGRRRGRTIVAGDASISVQLAPGDEIVTDRPLQMPAQTGRCDPNMQEQTDLSGTYTGTVNYTEGGLSGDTTLTVSGNNFTMTSGSTTQEGRIVAVTTCNYTAVTMMLGKAQTSAASGDQPPPLPAVSLRARRVGSGLALESVEGETRQFSFTPAGTSGGVRRPRARRGGRMGGPPPVGIKPPTAMSHAQ